MKNYITTYKTFFLILILSASSLVFAQQTQVYSNPEFTYQEALKLFKKEKYGAAQRLFEQYINEEHNSLKAASAQYYIAISSLYLEQPNADIRIINFAKNNSEHPKTVFAYFELGNFYYERKKYDNVINTFEEVDADLLTLAQKNEMRFKLGYAYFSKKQFDRAKTLFDRIKNQKHQYSSAASYYAGYIAFEKEDYNSAYDDFFRIKDESTYKKIVIPNLVKILYKQEKYNELIQFTENEKLNNTESFLYLAEAYFFTKKYTNAKENYEKYFARTSTTTDEVNYRYGYTLLHEKKYEKASEYFKKSALNDDELGQNSAFNLGVCYINMNRKDFALGAFLHASSLDFNKEIQEEAMVSYAKLNYENRNFKEAIRTLEKLNKMYPNSVHYKENEELLTDALVNNSDFKQAVDYLETINNKTYREKVAYQKASYQLAVSKYNIKEYEDAIIFFEKSLKYPIDKDLIIGASYWIAETYSIAGKCDNAIAMYARIFENDPLKTSNYYLKTRYGIGYAYYNTKQYERAVNHFQYYVLNSKPKSATEKLYEIDAITRLADCYYAAKDYGRAINEYKQVKVQNSLHKDYASFQLAVIEYLAGRIEDAKSDLEDIINHQKQSIYYDDALYQRAVIDLETGAFASAVAGFSDLIDYKPKNKLTPIAYAKRALAYSNLGKFDKEYDDYKYIIDNYITHQIAYTVIQSLPSVLAKLGKEENFDNYLEKYKKANPLANDLSSVEFESAKTLYFNQRFETAITSFERFLTSYPNTYQAYEVEYYLAESYRKSGNKLKATSHYEAVINQNKTDYVLRSIYKVAEIYFELDKFEKAKEKYELLAERGESSTDISRALRGQLLSLYNLSNYEKTINKANELLRSGFANDNQKDEAKLYIAKSNLKLNKSSEASTLVKEIVENNTSEIGAEANYLYADIKYNEQNYDHSIEILQALLKSYPNFEYWVSKSYLLIAKNLIKKGEDFQAKATLNSIIEHSKINTVKDEASIILNELNNKVENDKLAADTVEIIEIDTLKND